MENNLYIMENNLYIMENNLYIMDFNSHLVESNPRLVKSEEARGESRWGKNKLTVWAEATNAQSTLW